MLLVNGFLQKAGGVLDMGYVEEFRSYNGEISVGSYGFTLGRYTERASELTTLRET